MNITVPVAIVVAAVTSLSAQFYYIWPNYKLEQTEQPKQGDEGSSKDKSKQGDESSSKDKSEQGDESSSKDKSRKSDKSSAAVASKSRPHLRTKRQE
jgi:hypothetical protein